MYKILISTLALNPIVFYTLALILPERVLLLNIFRVTLPIIGIICMLLDKALINKYIYKIILFCIVSLVVSIIASPSIQLIGIVFFEHLYYIAYIIFISFLPHRLSFFEFSKTLVILTAFFSIVILLTSPIVFIFEGYARLGNPNLSTNISSTVIALTFLISNYVVEKKVFDSRALRIFFNIIMLTALALMFSKTILVSLFIVIILIELKNKNYFLLLPTFFLAAFSIPFLFEKILSDYLILSGYTISGRTLLWAQVLSELMEGRFPIGNSRYLMRIVAEERFSLFWSGDNLGQAHNFILDIVYKLGIFSLIFLAIIIKMMKNIIKFIPNGLYLCLFITIINLTENGLNYGYEFFILLLLLIYSKQLNSNFKKRYR